MNRPKEGFLPASAYLELAENTGFFRAAELGILKEVILDCQKAPDLDYYFFEEREGGLLAGFIIFGRVPLTDYSWDIYWIAVEKRLQGRGVGRRLLDRTQQFILGIDHQAILRIETSGKTEYESTRHFYKRTGFREAGFIPDFYTEGDGLQTYYKSIKHNLANILDAK
jgi:ribosomal protein S18 acetylase RimI-like enzyme